MYSERVMDSGSGINRGRGEVRVFDSVEELSTGLAEHVAVLSESAVKERGVFSLVLSGGARLLSLLQKLSERPYLRTLDWSRWHVFWGEENVLPRNHVDSHYKLAKEAFLSKVPISPSKMIPAVSTAQSSRRAPLTSESVAEDYEFRIRQLVRNRTVNASMSSDCPSFDLILLVLGPGGRVAALYPDHPVLTLGFSDDTHCPWIAPVKPPTSRNTVEEVTITLPVINSAAQVVVVGVGTAVAEAFASAVGGDGDGRCSPAKLISPANGKLVWFVDSGAASLVSTSG